MQDELFLIAMKYFARQMDKLFCWMRNVSKSMDFDKICSDISFSVVE